MGYYINETQEGIALPILGKANALIADGALEVPKGFQENLICVVENGPFDAAAYVFSEDEFEAFNYPGDYRRKRWLTHPKAKQLAGYTR